MHILNSSSTGYESQNARIEQPDGDAGLMTIGDNPK
jgi:hypothetical protein